MNINIGMNKHKMYERLGLKKEPKEKETELLKGSNYYPPEP